MPFADVLGTVISLFGPRTRRAWMSKNRAHVEYRDLASEELPGFRSQVERAFGALASLRWVEVNPHTRRVVVCFEDHAYSLETLIHAVEQAERASALDRAGFFEEGAEHPADVEPGQRLLVELFGDVAGLMLGTTLRFSPFRASSIGTSSAALIAILRASPKLRRGLDERLGARRADLAMALISSFSQGFAQRPLASLVDVAHSSALLREIQARRRVWQAREAELCAKAAEHEPGAGRVEARPLPLPRGPIEEYADRAWVVSLGGFALSFLTTRSLQRAVAALFGGLPKPARLGRDVFAAELGRTLARRGVLVRDCDVLRLLDRVDCLVLEGALVARDRFEIGEIIGDAGLDKQLARAEVQELFDADRPVEVQRNKRWALGPPRLLGSTLSGQLEERGNELAKSGALVLGLAKDGTVVGLIEIRIIPQTGIDELISAAHEAHMRVVVASNDESILQRVPADDTIPEGEGLRIGVRRLQREGRTVCLVATGTSPGIETADCAIGLTLPDQRIPWGAHILCKHDLSDVRFLLGACVAARRVAKQSVNVALGAATVGALVTGGGLLPRSTRRVITVVNAATLLSMANGVRSSIQLARRPMPPPRDRTPWHALDPQGVLAKLKSSEQGLSRREVQQRRNPHATPKPAALELFDAVASEMLNPLAPLLAAGAGLSAVVGSAADAGMVGGVVLLNGVVGGVQRFLTERKIKDLTRTAIRRAIVLRNGELRAIEASELVRGDMVCLSAGEVVPADCRIIECESLEVDASSLTGESLPVKKTAQPTFDLQVADRSSMLYEGTSIAAGRGSAVVVAVGEETEARRGAGSMRDPARGGVEQRLRSLINLTGPVALGAGVSLIAGGLLRGRRLADLVGSGVSLAVASIPEGLPLLATAAQLAAADRLSKRGALVRNARSIEALGRVDVLCVDKTGTVTQGRIDLFSVSDGVTEEPAADLSAARVAVLAAGLRATPQHGNTPAQVDPTDAALLRSAQALGVAPDYGHVAWQRRSEISFEAARGYHAVFGVTEDRAILSVKGAPEVILPTCTRYRLGTQHSALDDAAAQRLHDVAAELARRGLRVLAVAERTVGLDDRLDPNRLVGLTFYGFLAFSDPVRPSAAAALKRLRMAGVETVMITGDHPSTAEAIASELSLLGGKGVLTGAELGAMSDDELDGRIEQIAVFARVTPSQKVRVVRALQRAQRVVAMVGDGANDAPAIRLANVGIAIGEQCTAAARGAADIVLIDERIETLVHAIVEGRAMWSSVRDAVSILVGGNLGEIAFVLGAGLVDGRPPLNARQLLLVNLLTDVAPAMAIALRPPSPAALESLAHEGPDASLGHPLDRDIVARAAVTAAGAGTAWVLARLTGSSERASTVSLLALVGTQLGQTLVSGGLSTPVVVTSLASSAVLTGLVQTPGVSHFFGCRPLGPVGFGIAISSSVAATLVSAAFPRVIERAAGRLKLSKVLMAVDPGALPEAVRQAAELLTADESD
ncbi:MAG TPA: HAD-IC family P-type ATPase [Polyangiaceae bacterium]|nr:HAD-IC family P-type ATPase [Polyangiaceae bacterium]